MAITYKIDETFTGKRTTSMPDPDNEGETVDEVASWVDTSACFGLIGRTSVVVCAYSWL